MCGMGNCAQRCGFISDEEKEAAEEGSVEKEGRKVRVVLTRAELEWLTREMQKKNGKMSLADLLAEMAEGQMRWRPALESIMEVPEVQSVDRGGVGS
ncbi:hypothetical protein HPP92_008631 [Vanilla planifolia]|uniref:Uncharacterized protein n=1 Tax=Vanilla planifolia TaxID=51239 RepID=A0A835V3Y6_VANPL|nr:hypothetical protein HPP92_008631 [Vanilla planifolia]